jgi:hypothetical protein
VSALKVVGVVPFEAFVISTRLHRVITSTLKMEAALSFKELAVL